MSHFQQRKEIQGSNLEAGCPTSVFMTSEQA